MTLLLFTAPADSHHQRLFYPKLLQQNSFNMTQDPPRRFVRRSEKFLTSAMH